MSTDSPSTTDRLAEIAARLANASGSPAPWYSHFETAGVEITEPVHEILDAEGGRVCVTGTGSYLADLLEHAPEDLAYLVKRVKLLEKAQAEAASLQERLDTAEGQLAKAADYTNGPVQLAIHRAVCEDSLAHCVENRGRCVRSAEAAAWALGVDEEPSDV